MSQTSSTNLVYVLISILIIGVVIYIYFAFTAKSIAAAQAVMDAQAIANAQAAADATAAANNQSIAAAKAAADAAAAKLAAAQAEANAQAAANAKAAAAAAAAMVTTYLANVQIKSIMPNTNVCAVPNTATNEILLQTCNAQPEQLWNYNSNGEWIYKLNGMCLNTTGTANDAVINVAPCNGSAAQKWNYNSNAAIVNPASGRCVDISEWNPAVGNNTHLWDYNGTTNQKWLVQQPITAAQQAANDITAAQAALAGLFKTPSFGGSISAF